MNNEIKYEVTAGSVDTPEKGNIRIPPDKTLRKDCEEGYYLATLEDVSAKEVAIVETAIRNNITEIPAGRVEERDEGR